MENFIFGQCILWKIEKINQRQNSWAYIEHMLTWDPLKISLLIVREFKLIDSLVFSTEIIRKPEVFRWFQGRIEVN